MRWWNVGLVVVLLIAACGPGRDTTGSSGTPDPTAPSVEPEEPVVSITTSGFSGPTDTTPPSFGGLLMLPLADGFGVVCSGSTGGKEATFARLEGPSGDDAYFAGVVEFYQRFLEGNGFAVARMLDEPRWVVFDGWSTEAEEGVVSVTIRPTMHSITVAAAHAVDRPAFGLAADAMNNEKCWSGSELDDAAAGTYSAFGGEDVSDPVTD